MNEETITFVTNNLLAQRLCYRERYEKCDPKYLEKSHRKPLTLEILRKDMSLERVIFVQELTRDLGLETIATSLNYGMCVCYYGKEKEEDQLGVAVLYPKRKFILASEDKIQLGGWIKNNVPSSPSISYKRAITKKNCVLVCGLFYRKNHNGEEPMLNVVCMHGPCEFLNPEVMSICAKASAQIVENLTLNRGSVVWGGDFNFMPHTEPYQTIVEDYGYTNGNLTVNGSHHLFTTYGGQKEPFFGTLSHIFHKICKDGTLLRKPLFLTPIESKLEPDLKNVQKEDISKFIPDDTNPSDHVRSVITYSLSSEQSVSLITPQ